MNVKIVAVGKLKEKYWVDGCNEYIKRLSRYCQVNIIEVKESKRDDIKEEGVEILKSIKDTDYVITLELKGKSLTSEELSKEMDNLQIDGKSNVTFVIGGSNGLSKEVTDRGNFKLSFSKMTFPHQMMRIILLEQIYRSFKIIKREKYHK